MDIEFGRAARRLWTLDERGTFLNHGSFGACPRVVLGEQDRLRAEMERQPDIFFQRQVTPGDEETPLRRAAKEIGAFVGAGADRAALVENASTGVQCVLNSMSFAAGDEILITDHQYHAVQLAVQARCRETGAVPVVARIPLPTSDDEVLSRILDAAGPKVKLAIIDHITSPTALVFPVAGIISRLHERGILVLIDGAHAIGQLPLNLSTLGADWYVTNAHKWLYAPKGTALLYAAESVAAFTRPLVTSHFIDMGFPRSFDYVGTRDYSGWLSLPSALSFIRELGLERLRKHHTDLLQHGSELLMSLGARPVGPLEMCGAMRAFILPQQRAVAEQDAQELLRMLWDEERIQTKPGVLFDSLLFRICAQAYVDKADLQRLNEVLSRRGWPGR